MYRHSRLVGVMLAASMAFAFGCGQTSHSMWKDTKRYYREYLNPPAQVDFGEAGYSTPEEVRLANGFVGIDLQLRALERGLDNADRRPDRSWVEAFLRSYPWLAGAAAIDASGEVLARMPSFDIKNIDFSGVLEADPKQKMRMLRSVIVDTPLGPEIVVAVPLYAGMDFKGVIAVHFDVRALLPYSAAPADIVIAAPSGILWPGKYDITATPLHDADWAKLVAKDAFGTLSNAQGEFFWVTRYIGNIPLVFAVPVEGSFPEKPEQLAVLAKARELGTGGRVQTPAPVEPSPALGEDDPSLLVSPAPELPGSPIEESTVR
ncbi:PDC sensor domain-containing protein [Nitratidesulfovibrio vulgaris]|uniref:Lipoprotein, putative n=1 Tax=Nitratidesulfovibrio vulgaris (strain DP4) TaxID=391774 RepID=A0A0H3A795_NITV4|nr:hypothetical protein [Nitratidesulfovibrio vulgaris]GEB79501.1 lipoprotein [Desulfovibrio desulfuricans]HBW16451.1 hypothetical protein [Desulfovibrio sp.]ABM28338.1 lipoprotein, putative [Nitratidesulfovibrio vulgaris DP4]ADP86618.1 hypothetical protein Deval_1463 [Nitratidesulfovibrio vulgaris RCH1]WCB45327.1 hypothetical protein PH214_09590 [Nitratidesulfovibrio vulgaris]